MLLTYTLHEAFVSILVCQGKIKILSQKQKVLLTKGKRKIRDHYNSLAGEGGSEFRRRYMKDEHVSFIKHAVMRFRY